MVLESGPIMHNFVIRVPRNSNLHQKLPLGREHDHMVEGETILILMPISKNKIEKLIGDMLITCIVRHNNNPYFNSDI